MGNSGSEESKPIARRNNEDLFAKDWEQVRWAQNFLVNGDFPGDVKLLQIYGSQLSGSSILW